MTTDDLRKEIAFEESEMMATPIAAVYNPNRLYRLRAELASRTGTRQIKLTAAQVHWLCDIGPYPFTCNQNTIEWSGYTDEEVIAKMAPLLGRHSFAGLITRKLMGEIE